MPIIPVLKNSAAGKAYKYAHNFENHYVQQEYMSLNVQYYVPTMMGFEKEIKARLDKLKFSVS